MYRDPTRHTDVPLIRSTRMFEVMARFQRGTSDTAATQCYVRARRRRQRKALNSGFWSLGAGTNGTCPWRRVDLCHRHTLSDLIGAVLAAGRPSAQSIVPLYEQFLRNDAVLQRASAGQAQKFDTRTRLGDEPRGADSQRRVGSAQHSGRKVVVVQPDKPDLPHDSRERLLRQSGKHQSRLRMVERPGSSSSAALGCRDNVIR